ncbi:MAG: glycosyltransferase family 1 protein [Paracoccaceae bacterium]
MSASQPTCFLDISRLIARAGEGPLTGIDRVERAYLAHLCQADCNLFALRRTRFGWQIFDRAAARQILSLIDRPSVVSPRGLIGRVLARSRRLATPGGERIRHTDLSDWLAGNRAPRKIWISVGHWNLGADVLGAVASGGASIRVMIHDLFPLECPDWSGKGAPDRFAPLLAGAARHADQILFPSAGSARSFNHHTQSLAEQRIIPLGIEIAAPSARVPSHIPLDRPLFVAIGTIEPRKNIGLLLDVWDGLALRLPPTAMPRLLIAGRRGWADTQLLARLDRYRAVNGLVMERNNLGDADLVAVLQAAHALLAPSRAEGFGLPPAEAASLGLPVLATDLAVTREVLGDYPTYLPADRPALWIEKIAHLAAERQRLKPLVLPHWTDHFNLVFNDCG